MMGDCWDGKYNSSKSPDGWSIIKEKVSQVMYSEGDIKDWIEAAVDMSRVRR